jgi:hypothetical protein
MADKPKKKKRDLRARLGRTITPKTKSGGGPAAPPGGAGGPVPPPNLGGEGGGDAGEAGATPAPAGVTPPPAGVAAPPPGIGGAPAGGGGDVAPPPFASQPQAQAQPAAAPAQASDPFASSAPAPQQQVVRLEFDDAPVEDEEVGRKQRFKLFLVAGLVLVAGLGVGWGAGGMLEQRKIYNRTVRDGQEIYETVNEASQTVDAAKRHIDAIVTAAAGNEAEGTPPSVDYEAIEALRALEKPFDASAFTTKNYGAFQPNTVNDLFTYMMNVQKLWDEIRALAAQSLAEDRREELDRTAQATGENAQTLYGAVLSRGEDGRLGGSLAFLSIEEGDDGPRVIARATRGGQGREFQVYAGGEDQEIGETPEYVMLIDGATSRGVLAEQTGAFGRFLQKLRELKTLIDQTVEIQGRLLQALGEVARLEEI